MAPSCGAFDDMKRFAYILTGLVLVGCWAAPVVHGAVVLASNTWDTTTESWDAFEDYIDVTHDNTGSGNPDGFLDIAFEAGHGSASEIEAIVYQDAGSFFAGGWTNSMWIEFDFFAQDDTPDFLELRFRGTTSGDYWSYLLTPSSFVGTWTTYSVMLDHSDTQWFYGEGLAGHGSESDFLDDLGTIDWLGIFIQDGSDDANRYGLDNFQLMVPEPAEYALALSALAVIGLSVRKKRKKGVDTPDARG